MLAGLVIGSSTVVMSVLVMMGFVANTARFEDQLRPPGCYWTWAVALSLVLGAVTGSPLWVQIVGLGILLVTADIWVVDITRKAKADGQ